MMEYMPTFSISLVNLERVLNLAFIESSVLNSDI